MQKKTAEQFYIVEYNDNGERTIEGVFTRNAFHRWLKERNKMRKRDGEMTEDKEEFDLTPIEINK